MTSSATIDISFPKEAIFNALKKQKVGHRNAGNQAYDALMAELGVKENNISAVIETLTRSRDKYTQAIKTNKSAFRE